MLVPHCMNKNDQLGFSLLETLIAMGLSSFICIAAISVFPALFKQTHHSYIQYQIDREVRQVLINMEKDFRRIGYCSRQFCDGTAIKIEAKFLSRLPNSCIIFAYDQDLSGAWRNGGVRSKETDFFGYRLNNNKLESNRNVMDCNGSRWQSLFDPQVIKVNKLSFTWHKEYSLLEVKLIVKTPLLPNKELSYRTTVFLRNV